MDHRCTMFCGCAAAQRTAGGTAAESAPHDPRQGAPTSPRDAAARIETDQRRTTRWGRS